MDPKQEKNPGYLAMKELAEDMRRRADEYYDRIHNAKEDSLQVPKHQVDKPEKTHKASADIARDRLIQALLPVLREIQQSLSNMEAYEKSIKTKAKGK